MTRRVGRRTYESWVLRGKRQRLDRLEGWLLKRQQERLETEEARRARRRLRLVLAFALLSLLGLTVVFFSVW